MDIDKDSKNDKAREQKKRRRTQSKNTRKTHPSIRGTEVLLQNEIQVNQKGTVLKEIGARRDQNRWCLEETGDRINAAEVEKNNEKRGKKKGKQILLRNSGILPDPLLLRNRRKEKSR